MRIDQITIRNFKGFELRTFDFPRAPKGAKRKGSFHLLVGENGSGKSSTLDALAVAVGIWHVARPTAGWRAIRPGEARWQPVTHGDRMSFEPMPDPTIEAKGLVGEKEMGWTRVNHGVSTKTSNSAAQEALDEVSAMLERARSPDGKVTLPVLAHYSAGRAWLPQKDRVKGFPLNMKKGSRLDAYYYCLDGCIRDKELNQWFLYEMLETSQRGRKRDGLVAVETAVLNCLPDAKGLRFDADRKEIVLMMHDGEEMPFYNLSDGQRSTLALVADIAIKAVTLNPHLGRKSALKSPGVVMIDELDLHLHPKWQRRVIDDLKRTFPELQFICSTHSPFLIQSLRPGELIVLQEGAAVGEYANQSLEDIVESVQGVEMPQRSHRAEVMSAAVEEYVSEIKKPKATRSTLKQAEANYREATEPYSPNPGLNALLKLEAMAEAASPGGISDTRDWTEKRLWDAIGELKEKALDWDGTTGSARKWWEAFENENKTRPTVIYRLAEELRNRKATITEFFIAFVYSNTDNVQANLHFLDYSRLKKSEGGSKQGSHQGT